MSQSFTGSLPFLRNFSITCYCPPTKLWEGNFLQSRVSVILFIVAGEGGLGSVQDPGPSPLPPCTGGQGSFSLKALIPPRHAQTCSLCIPYCQQVGCWHCTEMPSCLKIRLHLFLTYLSFKTAPRTLRFHGSLHNRRLG